MRAKTRLFTEILPREGTAVLNRDSYYRALPTWPSNAPENCRFGAKRR